PPGLRPPPRGAGGSLGRRGPRLGGRPPRTPGGVVPPPLAGSAPRGAEPRQPPPPDRATGSRLGRRPSPAHRPLATGPFGRGPRGPRGDVAGGGERPPAGAPGPPRRGLVSPAAGA